MNTLIIIFILSLIVLYVKLIYERKSRFIGKMTTIIITFYTLIITLIVCILIHLKLEVILNFILIIDISLICLCNIIYTLLGIYSSKRYTLRKKYIVFDIAIIVLNIILLTSMIINS